MIPYMGNIVAMKNHIWSLAAADKVGSLFLRHSHELFHLLVLIKHKSNIAPLSGSEHFFLSTRYADLISRI